jgi:hypothetical protein
LNGQQRFCPICDQGFLEGEAVLRCQGCGVLHHPACWVRNDGCATANPHETSSVAEAYAGARTTVAPPHPGEGTRIAASARSEPAEHGTVIELHRAAPQALPASSPRTADDDQPVIGDHPPEAHVARRPPAPYMVAGPGGKKPPPIETRSRGSSMPRVYPGHALLRLWYVPVAALLAVGVAIGVIFGAEAIFGGDDDDAGAAVVTTPSATVSETANGGETPSETGTPGTSATSAASGKFQAGDVVVVTGSGDCLNVRKAPGRDAAVLTCLPDGEPLTIRGGPETIDNLLWWKVQTVIGEGWAAEQYLRKK